MHKVIVITGGTSGIGCSAAKKLTGTGNKVYCLSRNKPTEKQYSFSWIECDITNEKQVLNAITKITNIEKRIDVLINSAGVSNVGSIEDHSLEEFESIISVNFYGTIKMIKAVTPHMRKHHSGTIINISSIGGKIALPFQGIYSASKFAIEGLTEALTIELKPFGIDVHLIEPGDIKTDIIKSLLVNIPEDSPYAERIKDLHELLCYKVKKGSSAELVAKKITKITKKKITRLRVMPAKPLEKTAPWAKTFLPDKLFQKMLCGFYNL